MTPAPDNRWLLAISGYGGVLGVVLAGELVAMLAGLTTRHEAFAVGAVSSGIGIAVLLYGGYWAATNDISGDRYRRIAGWVLFGGTAFLGLNIAVMEATGAESPSQAVSWLRWALSLGGAAGLIVGTFEARAIERARAAERAQVHRQEAERQAARFEEFASQVSHDLRNPLNVAKGRLQLARTEVDNEHLQHVDRALERMDTMVDETLQLARHGQTVGETEPVALDSLVADSWESVDAGDATLVVEDLPTVAADAERLRHVFENLFRNAIEHGSTGNWPEADEAVERGSTASQPVGDNAVERDGDGLTVRVGALADGFYVEDDGPGIPEVEEGTVFDPGYTTTDGGTGFGLDIVHRIVHAHGWEISATSATDGGARFEVRGVDIVERQEPAMNLRNE